jgi:hypothetical protein
LDLKGPEFAYFGALRMVEEGAEGFAEVGGQRSAAVMVCSPARISMVPGAGGAPAC